MWRQMIFILPLIVSAISIKVPVDQNNDNTEDSPIEKADTVEISPTYYVSDDANVDSYLVPPDPHKPVEISPDVVTPATYLLPPDKNQRTEYFYTPTDRAEQTEWYPIAQNTPPRKLEAIPIFYQNANPEEYPIHENPRKAKAYEQTYNVPTPSLTLEPPLEDAPHDYFVPTSSEQLRVPASTDDSDSRIDENPKKTTFVYQPKVKTILPLHLIPPHPQVLKKYPKKFYPKKYNVEFKPVPIPIAQYADESASEIPRAKPVKLFKPLASTEIDYLTPADEKINYLHRQAENKRKLKGEELRQVSLPDVSVEDVYSKPVSTEQVTSESFRHSGRNVYPAPLKQATPKAPQKDASNAPAPDERTEFRMHGMKGPHSYQFGYDTGKGKNRQFRYEERDNDGQVKGHYGYMDRHGKLRVVNYSAHPDTGFHADAPVEKES